MLHWQIPPRLLQLPEREVHLWRGRLDLLSQQIECLWQLLSDDERSRATSFRTEKLRSRFVVGRGTLRTLLGRYASVHPKQVQFGYTSYGKPYMKHPSSEPLIQFNLAHANDMLLMGFMRTHPIGVDIEPIRCQLEFNGLELAAHYFAQDEYGTLLQLPAELQPIGFFNAWTRKEAFIKARGEGLSLPLDSFSVSLVPNDEPRIIHVADDPTGADHWRLVSFEPAGGHIAALAVPTRDWCLACFELC